MSHFTGVNLTDIIQFKFDGGNAAVTIFLDNLYFYKQNTIGINHPSLNTRQAAIYPNPARIGEQVTLGNDVQRYDLFDLSGRHIESVHCAKINTLNTEPGVYLVRIYSNDERYQVHKLIVY